MTSAAGACGRRPRTSDGSITSSAASSRCRPAASDGDTSSDSGWCFDMYLVDDRGAPDQRLPRCSGIQGLLGQSVIPPADLQPRDRQQAQLLPLRPVRRAAEPPRPSGRRQHRTKAVRDRGRAADATGQEQLESVRRLRTTTGRIVLHGSSGARLKNSAGNDGRGHRVPRMSWRRISNHQEPKAARATGRPDRTIAERPPARLQYQLIELMIRSRSMSASRRDRVPGIPGLGDHGQKRAEGRAALVDFGAAAGALHDPGRHLPAVSTGATGVPLKTFGRPSRPAWPTSSALQALRRRDLAALPCVSSPSLAFSDAEAGTLRIVSTGARTAPARSPRCAGRERDAGEDGESPTRRGAAGSR